MLEAVLKHLNNRFEAYSLTREYTVAGGVIDLSQDWLQDGQYFWVEGSVFNDGLHRWPCSDMTDEKAFRGTVCALAVPKAVVELAGEIAEWVEQNGDALRSPYQSESFGGYTYSMASGGGDGASATATWQSQFRSDLNRWRKL